MSGLWRLGEPAVLLAVRCAAIYLVLLFGLRLFGKREIGQFTLFDLVFVLLVANAVQPAMTGPDTSLLGGLVIIATLLVLNFAISWLRLNNEFFRHLVEPSSTVVARDGHWLDAELKRQFVTPEECEAALREHGVEKVKDTTLVVLEADGSLSVVTKEGINARRRRRVRFIKH